MQWLLHKLFGWEYWSCYYGGDWIEPRRAHTAITGEKYIKYGYGIMYITDSPISCFEARRWKRIY